ncbi:hypothetical protein EON67_10440 [archaeon]|nr:MAG: hypothetical protein EON67_10440 [archaeon]
MRRGKVPFLPCLNTFEMFGVDFLLARTPQSMSSDGGLGARAEHAAHDARDVRWLPPPVWPVLLEVNAGPALESVAMPSMAAAVVRDVVTCVTRDWLPRSLAGGSGARVAPVAHALADTHHALSPVAQPPPEDEASCTGGELDDETLTALRASCEAFTSALQLSAVARASHAEPPALLMDLQPVTGTRFLRVLAAGSGHMPGAWLTRAFYDAARVWVAAAHRAADDSDTDSA